MRLSALVPYCYCNKITTQWLKTTQIYYFNSSGHQRLKMGLTRLKPKLYSFLEALAEEAIFLRFQASRVCPHSLAHDLLPTSKPGMVGFSPINIL